MTIQQWWTGVIEWLKALWDKFKWYILVAFAVLALAAVLLLGSKKSSVAHSVLESVFKGQKKVVEKQVERAKAQGRVTQEQLNQLDEKLRDIDERVEFQKERIDASDLIELAEIWRDLGG